MCSEAPPASHLCRQVLQEIHKVVPDLCERPFKAEPLAIKQTMAATDLQSFKEPWRLDTCKKAISSTGLYEAGINITWVAARVVISDGLPLEDPTLHAVRRFAEQFFAMDSAFTVQNGPAKGQKRLIFPLMLEAFAEDPEFFMKPSFAGSVELLGGHAAVQAWYLAMHDAIMKKDDVRQTQSPVKPFRQARLLRLMATTF